MKYISDFASVFVVVIFYYALQIAGALLHFLILGSGAGADIYHMLFPVLMLLMQLIITYFLVKFIRSKKTYTKFWNFMLYVTPIVLFVWNYYV